MTINFISGKKKFLIFCFSLLSVYSFAQVLNDSQVFESGHWIYESLNELEAEQENFGFFEVQPMSVGEIKFYFEKFDFDKLSPRGQTAYKKVSDFLYSSSNFLSDVLKNENFRFAFAPRLNPEFYYKTNSQVDWSFNYDYKDNFGTLPLIFGFGNNVAAEADVFYGMDYYSAKKSTNFTNIVFLQNFLSDYSVNQNEAWILFCNSGFSKNFNGWGLSSNLGRTGLNFLNTLGGSVFYSDTFETDFFWQLNLFSDFARYSCDVVQIATNRYMYLHQIALRPFKNLKLSIIEGGLLNAPFELRFVNPIVLVHSYHARLNYNATFPYPDDAYASYFGWYIEYFPMKNLHAYILLAQDELQLNSEKTKLGLLIPNGIGVQLGADYKLPLNSQDALKFQLESTYTTPFMYIKSKPGHSFYSHRQNAYYANYIDSWTGTSYGPNTFATQVIITFDKYSKFSVSLDYSFIMHGDTDFSIFEQTDENGYYTYFPWVRYQASDKSDESYNECLDESRGHLLNGVIQYTNKFALRGEYKFSDRISLGGQILYSLIFNCNNLSGNTQHCVEFTLFSRLELFDLNEFVKSEVNKILVKTI